MGQKTVVLCEGPHDLIFISLVLDRAGKSFSAKKWDEIETYSHATPEATVISEFKGRRGNGISFLVKQDKDVDFCIESFFSLYEDYEGYNLKLVIDSDGESSIRKVRSIMSNTIHKDVLLQSETMPNVFYFKNSENKPAVFLYPKVDSNGVGKLTDIVRDARCGNLEGCRNTNQWRKILNDYLDTSPDWISEFEKFLIE